MVHEVYSSLTLPYSVIYNQMKILVIIKNKTVAQSTLKKGIKSILHYIEILSTLSRDINWLSRCASFISRSYYVINLYKLKNRRKARASYVLLLITLFHQNNFILLFETISASADADQAYIIIITDYWLIFFFNKEEKEFQSDSSLMRAR